jgi:hypothetical protein
MRSTQVQREGFSSFTEGISCSGEDQLWGSCFGIPELAAASWAQENSGRQRFSIKEARKSRHSFLRYCIGFYPFERKLLGYGVMAFSIAG